MGAIAGCGQTAAAPKPLAVVNGQAITNADWQTTVNALDLLNNTSLPTTTAAKKSQVQQMMIWAAIEQWALKTHVITHASAANKAKAFLTQVQGGTGGQKGFAKLLKSHHLSATQFQAFMTDQMIIQAAFTKQTASIKSVSASAAQTYYNQNTAQFAQPASDKLRIILVAKQAEAQSLLNQLKSGGNFAALAKKYSLDKASAASGGSIGSVPQGSGSGLPSQISTVMDSLKAGQYGIAHTSQGYFVMQVQSITPATTTPFSAVKTQIETQLLQQKQNQVFQAFGQKLESHDKVHLYVK